MWPGLRGLEGYSESLDMRMLSLIEEFAGLIPSLLGTALEACGLDEPFSCALLVSLV